MKKEEIKYRVVVSTNTFTTIFENQICAFVTGQVGECNVGADRRYNASADVRSLFEKSMERRMCSDDYWRPVSACADDINSFELYFKERPTKEMIDIIRDGCNEYADEQKEKNPLMPRISIDAIKVIKERTLYEETEETYDGHTESHVAYVKGLFDKTNTPT